MTNAPRAFLLVLACALPLVATAQWQWVDKDGRRVFSDKAPPPEVPAKNILRQPGVRGQPVVAEASAPVASAAKPAASGLKISGKDKELEDKRKLAEAAEAEKKKAAEKELAAQRAENCSRAKNAKATIDSGVRLARTNDKGEREIMDDQARAAELQKLQSIIARDCASAS
jgi:hypothetical protein